jgi:hypothetical protein
MQEIRPLIAAEPMLRAPSPEMLDELNGASAAKTGMAQRKSDARTHRTSTALRGKFIGILIRLEKAYRFGSGTFIWPGK